MLYSEYTQVSHHLEVVRAEREREAAFEHLRRVVARVSPCSMASAAAVEVTTARRSTVACLPAAPRRSPLTRIATLFRREPAPCC